MAKGRRKEDVKSDTTLFPSITRFLRSRHARLSLLIPLSLFFRRPISWRFRSIFGARQVQNKIFIKKKKQGEELSVSFCVPTWISACVTSPRQNRWNTHTLACCVSLVLLFTSIFSRSGPAAFPPASRVLYYLARL